MNDYLFLVFTQINLLQLQFWILPVILLLFLLFIYLNNKEVEIDYTIKDLSSLKITKKSYKMPFREYFLEEIIFYFYDLLDYGEDLYTSVIYEIEKHLIPHLKKLPLLNLIFKNYKPKYFISREKEISEINYVNRFSEMCDEKINRKKI